MDIASPAGHLPVRLLGMGVSGLDDTGQVQRMLFDGEELKGAKQNRILNTTILIAAGSSLDVPVSCTEQGRWSYASREFDESEAIKDPRLLKQALFVLALVLIGFFTSRITHLEPATVAMGGAALLLLLPVVWHFLRSLSEIVPSSRFLSAEEKLRYQYKASTRSVPTLNKMVPDETQQAIL